VAAGSKGTTGISAKQARSTEPPRYFYQLSARAQRTYLKSDAIERFDLIPSPKALSLIDDLMRALDFGAPSSVERAAQLLLDELCRLTGVRAIQLAVRGVRPHNAKGELHGIFYPHAPRNTASTARGADPLIVLWMRTAQRHDVVKPKTFFRTLMHELGHYLDYALLQLDDSFHTAGFFKRESFLVRVLYRSAPPDRNP